MTKLTDELLKIIANGSGRCYPHEGKAMAQELLDFRNDEKLRQQAQAASGHNILGSGSIP